MQEVPSSAKVGVVGWWQVFGMDASYLLYGGDMYAMTLTPPWGTAIALWGKRFENRGLPPPPCIRGGRPFFIHQGKFHLRRDGSYMQHEAGQRLARDIAWVARRIGKSEEEVLHISRAQEGCMVALVKVEEWLEVQQDHAVSQFDLPGSQVRLDPWMMPRSDRRVFAWRLDHVIPIQRRLSCRGKQGFWKSPFEWTL